MGAKNIFYTVAAFGAALTLGAWSLPLFSCSVLAEEAESETDAWMSYQLSIDGDVYMFPMMYEDFVSYGWSLESADETETETEAEVAGEKESEGETLAPYRYSTYYFTKEDLTCSVVLLNLGINTVSIEECIVAGISIDSVFWAGVDSVVALPGDLVRGVSDLDDILEAYGTPTDTYEGELYTRLTYQEEYNQEVELEVSAISGVLEDIQIENFVEPDGFDEGEVSTEIPQSVLAYVKPDSLSYDLSEYEIEVDGEVYSLPVPVSILVEDGWVLDTASSDAQIAAQYYGQVTLRKNNQSFTATVSNGEDFATTPEYCWLEELSVGANAIDLDGSLPGGVSIGLSEEEFQTILSDAGVAYAYTDSGNYRYYTYNNPSYGCGCEVTVYIGTDSIFEKDTIIAVSCENTLN